VPLNLSIFYKAVKAVEENMSDSFSALSGSSPALFFALITEPCLLLCNSEDTALEFYHDAVFWSESLNTGKPVLIPPMGDPYRLSNLKTVYDRRRIKCISSIDAALTPLWHGNEFPLLHLLSNDAVGREHVIETLRNYGYQTVSIVSGYGESSIRGGILDVFPPGEEFPVRIEFFGDDIESLRHFDVETQRTIKELREVFIMPVKEPDDGPNLIAMFANEKIILYEPDDIKRHYPELHQIDTHQKCIHLTSLHLQGEGFSCDTRGLGGFGLLPQERKNLDQFVKKITELHKQFFILIVSSSEGQSKRLRDLLGEGNIHVPILKNKAALSYERSPVITTSELSKGFIVDQTIILTGRDIFGDKPAFRPLKKSKVSKLLSTIEDFRKGDYLVHRVHGIGKFIGLEQQKVEGFEGDFIVIAYLGTDRLHVPLEHINRVQKYHAPEGVRPRIDKLGGKTWQKTQKRVKQKVKDMAEKLLSLYAKRSSGKGFAFTKDTELHTEFDGFFSYDETTDQLTSIHEIKRDMEQITPMDRLLCGDVGYGKTEVIMRACFKAVYDAKQVAVLVPTTILAEQHFDTFRKRFSAFPIRIDFLSRFKSRTEQKQTLKALQEGNIDIVIGTHRLLARDVQFYNLGLLIVDEEHKFGVTHKERVKTLKTSVDVLSLSATPIPRTLHMALSGIRPMSLIETPPEDRLAVRSFVARFNQQRIRDVLERELDRDGQAFFVHNRIHDIHSMAYLIKELIPGSRVAVAHGRMREKELEQIMREFFRKKINVLVSTAIIGSGLDVPTANTIIINRADKFGLADLYQLRGRVGRSYIRAYAYFLIPGDEIITPEARKKLQAIQELSYLGAGFRLAIKDLEIRGAGNLLGAEQSGHIEAVGFDMYLEMLESTVAELKGEKIPPKVEPVLDLKITAIIPEEYVEEPDLRLSLYRRIATVKDKNSLLDLHEELNDRFGKPPGDTTRLFEIMELKLLAKKLSVMKIQNRAGKIRIFFSPETPVTTKELFSLLKSRKEYLKFLPEGGIELNLRGKAWDEMFREIKKLLQEVSELSQVNTKH
jgi:transcription-repair coupling factor (superfamily II helicase)